jgi:hypothetical protein
MADSDERDYTHKSSEEVRRAQKIGALEGFLLWLAKADFYVLSISTYHSRARLVGLGAMVIFTALLAFSTSFYTLSTTLIGPDTPFRWPIAIFLASIYTFGIIMIDREIVGATANSWASMLVRVVFAVFIAMAVSYPAKLKFFEGRITQEINQIITERNSDSYTRINDLRSRAETERSGRLANIQKRIDSLNSDVSTFDKQIGEEQNRGFCGPKCQAYITQKDGIVTDLLSAEQQLVGEANKPALSQGGENEIATLENRIENEKSNAYDILFKDQALNRITENDPSARLISNFLLLFFMLLEMVPLALKWSLGSTEYHYYIEARNNLNKQKIVSITNLYMDMMQADPRTVLEVPLEITDKIAALMEDESRVVKNPENMFESLNSVWRASTHMDNQEHADTDTGGSEPSDSSEAVEQERPLDPDTIRE